jgi:cytochrome b561/polyisoprenoid-binding protein YceI
MPAASTDRSYGSVARALHWLTALLILTAIPLGLYANALPFDSPADLARKAQAFSLHKTVGVAAFLVALVRILWALAQPRPVPLHPGRLWETRAAALVHWALYLALVAVPLSGWVLHAATTGFAPILWPLGQDLPLVPKSAALAAAAAALHGVFTKLLGAAVLLHVAGALRHALVDRDATLARMWRGTPAAPAPDAPAPPRSAGPAAAAAAIHLVGAVLALALAAPAATGTAAGTAPPAAAVPAAGLWRVQDGRVEFTVRQLGATVRGGFSAWTADIGFDPDTGTGRVEARIDTASLSLGAVGDEAKSAEFFDVAHHPEARFAADIAPAGAGAFTAAGTLRLRGVERPVTLAFTLTPDGAAVRARGRATLDRRDFGMGPSYPDAGSVGFAVEVEVEILALPPPA